MYIEFTQHPDSIHYVHEPIDTVAKVVRELTQAKYNLKKVQIIPFPELISADKPAFGGDGKDIYAVKVEEEAIMYVYFHQNRIWSFYHFQKGRGTPGESAFFLIF